MNKNLIKTMGTCLALVVVFGLIMFGISFYTEPLIKKNQSGAMTEAGLEVMPGGEFEVLYDEKNAGASELTEVSSQVNFILKETTGKGFVFRVSTVNQKEANPVILTYAVNPEGKILSFKLNQYQESYQVGDAFLNSFIGQDNTLADVELVGGVTVSSSAIKKAVEEGFNSLIKNNLIQETVKTPEQILTELIPTVHQGMPVGKFTAITEISGNIASGFKANNNSGFALIMNKGEEKLLVITNGFEGAKVYNVEGVDVTIANNDLVTEAVTYQTKNGKEYYDIVVKKLETIMEGATNFTKVNSDIFNTSVEIVSFNLNEKLYYGISTKPFGYDIMDVYVIVDEDGKIVKVKATEAFIDPTGYIPAPDGINEYGDKFVGMDGNEAVDGVEVIGSATLSSNAFKQGVKDALAAFKNIIVGGAE